MRTMKFERVVQDDKDSIKKALVEGIVDISAGLFRAVSVPGSTNAVSASINLTNEGENVRVTISTNVAPIGEYIIAAGIEYIENMDIQGVFAIEHDTITKFCLWVSEKYNTGELK